MEYVFSNISDSVIFSPHNCNLELILKSAELYFDDAIFFLTGTGLERVGVIGPVLDRWRAGLQAPGSSGLK